MSLLDEAGPRSTGGFRTTPSGVSITRAVERVGSAAWSRTQLENSLNHRRGLLLFRGNDHAVGYVDPPVEIVVRERLLTVTALNERGAVLLPNLRGVLGDVVRVVSEKPGCFVGEAVPGPAMFAEEHRTRHSGVFAAVRALVEAMSAPHDDMLGLYGAFGYDLLFEVEPMQLHQLRDPDDRSMVLHLPDSILSLDMRADEATLYRYEFTVDGITTEGLSTDTPAAPFHPGTREKWQDHQPGEYAELVSSAMPLFASGDLYEVVPGQVFRQPCTRTPAELFRALRTRNPTEHSLLANLGAGEYLIGASPEMFVRVSREDEDLVVDSAPISGTISRGRDAIEDAVRIRELLGSVKEESELTMCTDVDRNDKARVCVPGTVEVTARRKIEMYSELIHTVDHVRGVLSEGRDALDGFLAHLWAVTVTGAPKLSAVEFIERYERSPRRWYGGAVGRIGFDGCLDTVLTLRTIQVADGEAYVRAGATLLHDSDPAAEEAETELKAKALLRVLNESAQHTPVVSARPRPGAGKRIMLVDHRDSFSHCLADYLRQTGAEVITYRSDRHLPLLAEQRPDLVVLSPGPGRPKDFSTTTTLAEAERLGIPVFGVCLGLQAIVEHFGGELDVLAQPVHGKSGRVLVESDQGILAGLAPGFEVGRYHSLHARATTLPAELTVTGRTPDGVVMAIEHRDKPYAGVQFHPESIMTAGSGAGQVVIDNALSLLTRQPVAAAGSSVHGNHYESSHDERD